ncbi:hypothetical protein GA0111570_102350 [Raineyella antarctica]|uniref:Uncharacterized protein n=1 Tax=Raineyella antarctica TaxID=1577474 RepID=A0A1G6GF78_9ACTN|nr:hypothetical protein [Raineyella antarctica]SDB80559.1 hypothetical protein GA0111570_102350 [Raineyella antarctica]
MDQYPPTNRFTGPHEGDEGAARPAVDRATMEVTVVICVVLAAMLLLATLVLGSALASVIGLVNLVLASAMTGLWARLNS